MDTFTFDFPHCRCRHLCTTDRGEIIQSSSFTHFSRAPPLPLCQALRTSSRALSRNNSSSDQARFQRKPFHRLTDFPTSSSDCPPQPPLRHRSPSPPSILCPLIFRSASHSPHFQQSSTILARIVSGAYISHILRTAIEVPGRSSLPYIPLQYRLLPPSAIQTPYRHSQKDSGTSFSHPIFLVDLRPAAAIRRGTFQQPL